MAKIGLIGMGNMGKAILKGLLKEMQPEDMVFTAAHRETMEKLSASGIRVYRTDEQGTLIATSDGSQITWETAASPGSGEALPGAVQEAAPKTATYVLNKNSMKFHYPDCTSVSQMKEANKIYYEGSREEITGMGYSPCSQCNP